MAHDGGGQEAPPPSPTPVDPSSSPDPPCVSSGLFELRPLLPPCGGLEAAPRGQQLSIETGESTGATTNWSACGFLLNNVHANCYS